MESIHLSTYITHVKDILSTKALSAEIKDLESQYNANSRLCGKSYYSMSTHTFHIINLCINQIEGTKMLSNMLPTLAPNSSVLQLCIMQKAVDALSYDAYLYAPTRIIMWAITQEICCSMVILVDWLLDIDLKLIAHSMHQICSASPPYCLLCSLRNFISDEIKTKIKAARI